MSQHKAAELIGISERHLRRKRKRYEQEGVAGLAHKGRGRTSNRRLCDELRLQLITLAQSQYVDYGPTLMAEYVGKDHGIRVDHETLRKLLIEHGVHRVKKRRYKKDHIQPHLVKTGTQITVHEAFDGTIQLSQKGANI